MIGDYHCTKCGHALYMHSTDAIKASFDKSGVPVPSVCHGRVAETTLAIVPEGTKPRRVPCPCRKFDCPAMQRRRRLEVSK